jgi:hypothetical protein
LLFPADAAPPPCQGRVGVSELDVRSGESWGEAWSACERAMGVPSVLINIAGLRGEQDWDTLYDVNVVSQTLYLELRTQNMKICL